jgi:mercuric ion binding protein
MKNSVIAVALLLATTGIAAAGEQEARIEVSGLFCPSCSYIAGEALERAASVKIVDQIPSETGDTAVYVVTYDDTQTNVDEIVAQPVSFGYEAQLVTAQSDS